MARPRWRRGGLRRRAVAEVTERSDAAYERLLATRLYIGEADRCFGEVTLAEAGARADELRAAVGWGPTVRVAPVARAWRELAIAMERSRAAAVRDLEAEELMELAPRLWVVLPGG